MTTDTVPRPRLGEAHIGASKRDRDGNRQGAGMIRPDMATLLAFVATDAPVAQGALERLLADAPRIRSTASASTAIPPPMTVSS